MRRHDWRCSAPGSGRKTQAIAAHTAILQLTAHCEQLSGRYLSHVLREVNRAWNDASVREYQRLRQTPSAAVMERVRQALVRKRELGGDSVLQEQDSRFSLLLTLRNASNWYWGDCASLRLYTPGDSRVFAVFDRS